MSIEAMKLALEALAGYVRYDYQLNPLTSEHALGDQARHALRAAIEQAEKQEPRKTLVIRGQKDKIVAIYKENDTEIVRAEMPKQEWQGLTVGEAESIYKSLANEYTHIEFTRAIEAKLKEKNT